MNRSHPTASLVALSACNAGDLGSIPGPGRSPEDGNGNPLQYSCHGEFQDQRSLVGYSPWGLKESDMTHTHTTQRQQGNLGESCEMKQKKRIIKY